MTTSFFAQSQITIDYGKQWNVHDYRLFEPIQISYIHEFRSDTIYNGEEYLVQYYNTDSLQIAEWIPTGWFLREDDENRIYTVYPGFGVTDEILLYDFSLNEGDTITVGIPGFECEFIVSEIDSLELLNGDFRKRLKLLPSNNSGEVNYWVQGIGSMSHLTGFPSSCYTDYPYDLLCYYEDDELLYSNPNHEPCFYVLPTVDLQSNFDLDIYPNPVRAEIFIDTDLQIENITLYNSYGSKLLNKNSHQERLDVSEFPNGVYFLEITIDDERAIRKVVIQK